MFFLSEWRKLFDWKRKIIWPTFPVFSLFRFFNYLLSRSDQRSYSSFPFNTWLIHFNTAPYHVTAGHSRKAGEKQFGFILSLLLLLQNSLWKFCTLHNHQQQWFNSWDLILIIITSKKSNWNLNKMMIINFILTSVPNLISTLILLRFIFSFKSLIFIQNPSLISFWVVLFSLI